MIYSIHLRRLLVATVSSCALFGASTAIAQVRSFDIDAQPARTALPEFARQSGLQVLASGADVGDQRVAPVHGRMDAHAALHQLLAGTDLTVASDDGRTLALKAHSVTQAAAEPPSAPPATQAQEVVVTGTAIGRSKLEAPYAITTFSARQIDRDLPQSTVGLLRLVPGFSAEASGGEGGGQNLYVRGLPAGGWYYVQLQENGLSLFDEPQESFLNIDNLYRYDLMTDHVEVVRGGTSPIFATNAPGGTVNIIERSGTTTPHGALRVTGGDHGLWRVDGYASGPINDRVLYAVGGFYRQDNGFREPGYTADQGGQITARLSFLLDRGRLDLSAKYLNDKTIFYTDIPLNAPRNPSVSLNGLLNQNYGTLDSLDFQTTTQRSFFGKTPVSETENLANGIHTDITQISSTFDYDLGSAWKLTNRFGFLDGRVGYDALFSGASPQNAATYLANDLKRAQAGFGAQVTSVGYVLANQTAAGGGRVAFNPATTDNLVLESGLYDVSTQLRSLEDDLRITRSFQTDFGHHDLAFGVALDNFGFKQYRLQDTILTSLQSQARALDVLAYNSAGQAVGSVTQDGIVRYGSAIVQGDVNGYYLSGYASDQWRPIPKLGFDAGVRYTYLKDFGRDYQTGTLNLGDPTTLADDNAGGLTGGYTSKAQGKDTISWTAGTEYRLLPEMQLFARYTGAERFARLQNIYLLQVNPVTKIAQAEGGVRTSGPYSFSAIGFYSHFNNLGLSALVLNPQTGTTQTLPLIGTTETYGFEGEVNLRPIHALGLIATLTAQNPRTENLQNLATGALGTAYNNKQLQQIPQFLLSAQPTAYLDLLGRPTEWSATIVHVGDRFVDYANTTRLPAYTTVDFSVLAHLSDAVDAQLQATNAFNSRGLTEGNPRTDILNGQGNPTAIYGRPVFGRLFQGSLTYHW